MRRSSVLESTKVGVVNRVYSVSGPVVAVKGTGVSIGEVVYVGEEGLIGEVVRVAGNTFTVQVYESTSGLRPGEPVYTTGKLLTAELGPGLMGEIFDGVQRPLEEVLKLTGSFVRRGARVNALDRYKKWSFTPSVKPGEKVEEGDVVGTVPETRLITHKVLVPPGVRGVLKEIYEGDFTVKDTIGVVETPDGRKVELKLMHEWPVRTPRPYKERLSSEVPLITGQRVIDTFFPVAKGGAACIPGGFGTGKTVTLHKVSMYSLSDIVIYIGCGERGNEIAELLKEFPALRDPKTGYPIMERSIVIANTSNMPVSAREASIYMGLTMAEYYRDMGYDVTLIADSTSRWAEAIREISGRLGEIPSERGFPAYLPDRLAEFYERAGRVKCLGRPDREGAVTALGAVSPPGGDFTEPVTTHTLRFVGTMWALDTDLAYRRHFPAINWLKSFSQYAEIVEKWWMKETGPDFPKYRKKALRLLATASEIEAIASIVGESALPDDQRLILLAAEILREGFLRQVALEGEDVFCPPRKQYLMLKMMLDFFDWAYYLVSNRVPVEEIADMPEISEMIRVKEDERGIKAVEELYERVKSRMEALANKYDLTLAR